MGFGYPDRQTRVNRALGRGRGQRSMTDMVHGLAPARSGDPVIPRWWRTIDKWTMSCILGLFGMGMLLGFAASPPLAQRNGLPHFHYVERQAMFGGVAILA